MNDVIDTSPEAKALCEFVATSMRTGLQGYIGVPRMSAQERLEQAVQAAWGRSIEDRPEDPIRVEYTNPRVKLFFDASPAEVCDIVNHLYDEGRTHEDVTAWLDEHAPTFREHLVQVELPSHKLQWIVRPSWVMKG